MPTFSKMSVEEVEQIKKSREAGKGASQRELIMREYVALMEDLEVGGALRVTLEEGDNRVTVKNRLKRAAQRLQFDVTFPRRRGYIFCLRIA